MTSDEFKAKFGENWQRFTGTAMYAALLSVIETEHVRREKHTDGELLNGAVVFLNQGVGYDKLADKIKALGVPAEHTHEVETTFAEAEV